MDLKKAEFCTASTCRFLMKQTDVRETDGFPALFPKAKAKIDVVQFNRQALRIKAFHGPELAALHSKACACHGCDLVGNAVARDPTRVRLAGTRAEMACRLADSERDSGVLDPTIRV